MIYAAATEEGFPWMGGPTGHPAAPGTRERPMTVRAALDHGVEHVHLQPGWYRGADSMLDIVNQEQFEISGEGVWIDGGFERTPLRIKRCKDFVVSGSINVFNGAHTPVGMKDCARGSLLNVGAWNDPVPDRADRRNDMIYSLHLCEDVALDGCFGFGFGRKTVQAYKSIRTIIRSGWYRWDDWHPTGNRMVIAPSYASYDTHVESCYLTVAGSWDPTVAPPEDRAGACHMIANDGIDDTREVWEKLDEPDRPKDETRWLVNNCWLYQHARTRRQATIGIRSTDQTGVVIESTNISMEHHPEIKKTLHLSGTGHIYGVSLGAGQWAKIGGNWVVDRLGYGLQALTAPASHLKARVQQATRISGWEEAVWP